MNGKIVGLIILGVIAIMLSIEAIFRMKYKKDMYVESLKHYEEGTSYLNDKILEKIFKIDEDGK